MPTVIDVWVETASRSPRTATQATLRGIRVLVVEDNPDEREAVVALLSSAGAEILAVASADRALHALSSWRPDVLVSDIGLPGASGYQLIDALRAAVGPLQLPAVAVTGQTSYDERKRALRSGFQAHLSKPVDAFRLIEVVARYARAQ